MPRLSARVKNAVVNAAGSEFWRVYVITSSNITVAAKRLTSNAVGGDLIVKKVVLQTDSTGLAGGTNFQIGVTGETYGLDLPIVETVANLGASITRQAPSAAPAADTTNDYGLTVTSAVPFILQAGTNLDYRNTVAAGTGAGKMLIAILFQRVVDGADMPDISPKTVA